MSEIETGGRAFPCDNIVERDSSGGLHGPNISSAGLSVRDYFAVRAPDVPDFFLPADARMTDTKTKANRFFEWRWFYADQMIAARNAKH